ncbi:MAG: laccase domain-containing protein [Candidatus Vogelbacteria bacterium]|nr:laccase domain-containing protein [Candidatus Vogelbacteria bacterium]
MIKPTLHQSLWDGSLDLYYFGLDGFRSWHELRTVSSKEQNVSVAAKEALDVLGEICDDLLIENVFIPSPENRSWITYEDLLPNRVPISLRASLWRGITADGLKRISSGSAFGILGGDCPIGLIQNIDTKEICAGHVCRENMTSFSVPIIAHAMLNLGEEQMLRSFIGCSIAPKYFVHKWDDSRFGEANRKLTENIIVTYGRQAICGSYETGRIDLKAMWFAALSRRGVSKMQMETDDVDTYSDPSYGSNRRDGRDSRTLILAVNRS